jgi:selenocysteine lyase/cysteine desulfurase
VYRLQQILGIAVPPAARKRLFTAFSEAAGDRAEELERLVDGHKAVVFVGPYEHHSNELTWRECFAEVIEIALGSDGLLDLEDLESKVSSTEYGGRFKIGAFSAGSNVSGIRTPVYEVAKILHRYGALAFFDFAAVAPYLRIDVSRDSESYFDAVYFSPHKFLGGPGSSGLLVFRKSLYRSDLPPTIAAGGTVDFVSADRQDYTRDIEAREQAGTPPILQTMKAALAMELKARLGEEAIEAREQELIGRALERIGGVPAVSIVGNVEPEKRIGILSFVVRSGNGFLHPRFVTLLMNDLFGIQTRAGCTCAGPYGHRLLDIDADRSQIFRRAVLQREAGLKPGWTRLNLHYLLTEDEFDFLCRAVEFVAERGALFLSEYIFDIQNGTWRRRSLQEPAVRFGLDEALAAGPANDDETPPTKSHFDSYMEEAYKISESLERDFDRSLVKLTDRKLVPFLYVLSTGEESCGQE